MKKKYLSLLLALTMAFSLFAPAMAAAPATTDDLSGKLIILHTNDTHGGDMADEESLGQAGVAQLKKDYEAAGADVLLFSAGDAIQGAPIVNLDKGQSEVKFMNAAGYDAMAPGNHEFDYGTDNLLELEKQMEFPILCANIISKDTGAPLFTANQVFTTASGVKVGVFGLDTPETYTKANPKFMVGLEFKQGEELYACAQQQVDQLKAAGCQLIVALGHLGVDPGSEPNRSIDVAQHVNGIDLFIDGHSHSTNDVVAAAAGGTNVVNNTLIVSTGTKLANIGVVTYADGKLDFGYMSAGTYTGKDAALDTLVTDRNSVVDQELSAVFATTEVLLDGNRDPGVRTQETNLGDFATDAMLWQAREYLGEDKVDAAFTNGGGIRETIKAGDVSMKDMKTVFPFNNTVYTLDLTGAQILEMLEANTNTTPTSNGGFPQVAGMTYTIDTSVAYAEGEQYPDSTFFAPANPGSRVKDVTIGGEALDLAKTYTLVTNDYTASGGDAYYVLTQAENGFDTTLALEDALVNYTREVLGGVISAEQYGAPAGRITVKYAGVKPDSWYTEAARQVMDLGLMSSTGNGFTPSGAVTRATVFQTLYNMAGKPAVEEKATFTDIPEGAWYADSAAWAEDNGLAKGTGDGLFNGERNVTRQEIATMLYAYAQIDNRQIPTEGMAIDEFADADTVADWAVEALRFTLATGIIGGKDGNRLDPTGEAIRAELATLLTRYLAVPEKAPDWEGKYTEETVSIEVKAQDGVSAHTIPAILTLPVGASKDAPVPAVVMLHGTGSDKHEAGTGYDLAAPQMAAQGLASIRIDFMGSGDSAADYAEYSYTSANIDAKAAADYLAGLDAVDGDKLAVMGWSQGGTNALLAAAKYPAVFKAVVTWSGALDLTGLFGETSFDDAYAAATKDGHYTMNFDWREPLNVGEQWFKDVKATDVLAQVKKIKAPVLAINGELDVVVPMENATAIKDAAKDGQTWIVDGADHTYNVFSGDYAAINQAIFQTAAFIQKELNGTILATITAVEKYGNIELDVKPQDVLDAGFAYGDILSVTAGGQTLSVPFGTAYSDVDNDELVARHNVEDDLFVIAINMGNFAKTYGVAEGDKVAIAMGEKAGYLAEFEAHQVTRTNERTDYSSDEVFANFRPITLGKIADGVLYRTSSPVNPTLGRAAYADDLIEKAGIKTVVNLADANEDIDGYIAAEGFDSPYYKGLYEAGNVVALNMGVDFSDADFQAKLKTGLEFMLSHDAPYAFHCTEGKDRAGFMAILLEALMGAKRADIVTDYMASYVNYYHVKTGSDQYKTISKIAEGILCQIAGLDKGSDLSGVDLVKAAEDYLTGIGMTADQITALKTTLSTAVAADKAA